MLNFLLVRRGCPPVIIHNRRRLAYLAALRKVDAGNPLPLAEMLGLAVKDSLYRFLLSNLAGPVKLLPLSALTRPDPQLRALRAAADRGRLRAIQSAIGKLRLVPAERWQSGLLRRS